MLYLSVRRGGQLGLAADKRRKVNRDVSPPSPSPNPRHSFTCKPVVCLPLLFLYIYSPISSYIVWFPWKQRLRQKKKKTVSAREFFSSVFLSLPPSSRSLSLSPCLHRSLKVKQRAERSISLINTTQQHSALRGEMKRHGGMSTCRPGVVLTNDTYHTSHG